MGSDSARNGRRSSDPVLTCSARERVPDAATSSADGTGSGRRGHAVSSVSAPGDLSDATQRLELEVVELCRALGGSSPQLEHLSPHHGDDEELESPLSPPPARRAKGAVR